MGWKRCEGRGELKMCHQIFGVHLNEYFMEVLVSTPMGGVDEFLFVSPGGVDENLLAPPRGSN